MISTYCEDRRYSWITRSKDKDSILQKIETGRYGLLSKIDDFLAYSIIIPTLADESHVLEFLASQFDVCDIRSRLLTERDPRSFDFDSTRAYCKLRRPPWDDGDKPWVYDLVFEIQIRSALEHAWATVVHDLTYKGGNIDWRKIRLASGIKAQLEIIDVMLRDFNSVKERIEARPWKQDNDRAAVIDFLDGLAANGKFPRLQLPADLIRLADNVLRAMTKSARRQLPVTLAQIEQQIDKMNEEGFPRSLTAFQVIIITLVRLEGTMLNSGQTLHITSAMKGLYPEVSQLPLQFVYDI
ncbi:RelA/SpoT domain-containing protein [Rhodopseudomonas palustris]|uniref:RelA/SpoT domain-containing protein n=1 Tax=Rhodopseudomonas palustris TaxID=1076 RepID=UPI0020CEDDBB|nr:RelA/SpoT domain-containing protein [Rhodopseudomonas palustris]